MRDFTIQIYKKLLETLQSQGYTFQTFIDFQRGAEDKAICLRHDVDRSPQNSLTTALIESKLGLRGSYYFRIVPECYNEEIIKRISDLNHEIGYHYEDLSIVYQKIKNQKLDHLKSPEREKRMVELGIKSFKNNFERLDKIAPVKSICMHGSPLSRWDSRLLWKYYDPEPLGIIGDPYFDISFEDTLYLTDTGRKWNGNSVSIRDKPSENSGNFKNWIRKPIAGSLMDMSHKSIEFQNLYIFRSTFDIIIAAERNRLPRRIMVTVHPQRWDDGYKGWIKELINQNTKNTVKFLLIKTRQKFLQA